MKARITPTLLKSNNVPEGSRRLRVHDTECRGFAAEIRRSGSISFHFRYSDQRHREQRVALGRLGDVTVAQARSAAEKLRARVALGEDPAAERRERLSIPTVKVFVEDRLMPHLRQTLRGTRSIESCARRVVEVLGRKPLDEVTQLDVQAFRAALLEKGLSGATVNRHLAFTRAAFARALRWGLYAGDNPARSPGMSRETLRDRYLTPEQGNALARALGADHDRTAATALLLLMLTGARTSEILLATWDRVDFTQGLLTVPVSKNGRTHRIPLSPPATALLRQYGTETGRRTGYIFQGRKPGAPLSGLRGAWKRARRTAGLPDDLRIHDLRHAFCSALAAQGVPLERIGAIVGHQQLATTARYSHYAPGQLIETASLAGACWGLTRAAE